MPSGYQDRTSDTYWTGTNLTWDGTKWSSGSAVSSVTLTPTGALHTSADEIRIYMKVNGCEVIGVKDGSSFVFEYATPGVANQYMVHRQNSGITTDLQFNFDALTTVEIYEIEFGYNATF